MPAGESAAARPIAHTAPAKRHKVLLLVPNLQQGGSERQILELMSHLPPRFEASLCVYEDVVHYREYLPVGEPRNILGVHRMGLRGLHRLNDVLRAEQPDILHVYRDKANFWARLATMSVPVPVVITSVRNRWMAPLHLLTEWYLSRRSDRVIANSEGVRRELVNLAQVKPEAVQVIHNFIDTSKFRPPRADERARARRQFGIAPHETIVVLPGRISWQKHQLGLAHAVHLLKRADGLPDNVRFLLAGRDRDRMVAALLPRVLRRMRLTDRVQQVGPVADIVSLYHAADAVVMPSLFEGLSNAVLEAHACGLPVVASHAANIDELVLHGKSGFEVPTFDHEALALALGRLTGLSADERQQMGACGRRHVAERFSSGRVLGEVVRLYDELLAQKGLA